MGAWVAQLRGLVVSSMGRRFRGQIQRKLFHQCHLSGYDGRKARGMFGCYSLDGWKSLAMQPFLSAIASPSGNVVERKRRTP